MIPEELFKRRPRHNNTPESTLLILANFIVICAATSLFTTKTHINWFFWVVVGLLGVYNFFTIRRNREEFENKFVQISYVISTLVLVGLFFLLKGRT
jgi:nicotinamide riboside transporter PnuC